jgi:hypothetical protein
VLLFEISAPNEIHLFEPCQAFFQLHEDCPLTLESHARAL